MGEDTRSKKVLDLCLAMMLSRMLMGTDENVSTTCEKPSRHSHVPLPKLHTLLRRRATNAYCHHCGISMTEAVSTYWQVGCFTKGNSSLELHQAGLDIVFQRR